MASTAEPVAAERQPYPSDSGASKKRAHASTPGDTPTKSRGRPSKKTRLAPRPESSSTPSTPASSAQAMSTPIGSVKTASNPSTNGMVDVKPTVASLQSARAGVSSALTPGALSSSVLRTATQTAAEAPKPTPASTGRVPLPPGTVGDATILAVVSPAGTYARRMTRPFPPGSHDPLLFGRENITVCPFCGSSHASIGERCKPMRDWSHDLYLWQSECSTAIRTGRTAIAGGAVEGTPQIEAVQLATTAPLPIDWSVPVTQLVQRLAPPPQGVSNELIDKLIEKLSEPMERDDTVPNLQKPVTDDDILAAYSDRFDLAAMKIRAALSKYHMQKSRTKTAQAYAEAAEGAKTSAEAAAQVAKDQAVAAKKEAEEARLELSESKRTVEDLKRTCDETERQLAQAKNDAEQSISRIESLKQSAADALHTARMYQHALETAKSEKEQETVEKEALQTTVAKLGSRLELLSRERDEILNRNRSLGTSNYRLEQQLIATVKAQLEAGSVDQAHACSTALEHPPTTRDADLIKRYERSQANCSKLDEYNKAILEKFTTMMEQLEDTTAGRQQWREELEDLRRRYGSLDHMAMEGVESTGTEASEQGTIDPAVSEGAKMLLDIVAASTPKAVAMSLEEDDLAAVEDEALVHRSANSPNDTSVAEDKAPAQPAPKAADQAQVSTSKPSDEPVPPTSQEQMPSDSHNVPVQEASSTGGAQDVPADAGSGDRPTATNQVDKMCAHCDVLSKDLKQLRETTDQRVANIKVIDARISWLEADFTTVCRDIVDDDAEIGEMKRAAAAREEELARLRKESDSWKAKAGESKRAADALKGELERLRAKAAGNDDEGDGETSAGGSRTASLTPLDSPAASPKAKARRKSRSKK